MRESRLITLLQLQKPEGLQALMATYQAYVGTIIRNITRNSLSEQDVEELTADTFFAVWQTTDKLQAGKVRAYLAAIARNKAKSRLRSLSETIPLEEEAILLETADLEQEVEHTLLYNNDTFGNRPRCFNSLLLLLSTHSRNCRGTSIIRFSSQSAITSCQKKIKTTADRKGLCI